MRIVGHRGARGLAPENTLVALQKALDHGVDEIEFDVRVTADNIPVLLHDPELIDHAGNKVPVNASTYKELRLHKPDLATLDEALAAFSQKAYLYIEVKPGVSLPPIIAVIRKHYPQSAYHRFALGSYSQNVLLGLHEAFPAVEKVVIESWSSWNARRRGKQVNTKRVSMNQRWLWFGFIRAMSAGGWRLYAYTLNDPVKAKRWAKHGLAGAITDYPDRFEK